MKKIILALMVLFGLIGCGINCDPKPPNRAIMHKTGGMGMRYAFTLYSAQDDASHSPQRCISYSYLPTYVYTDDLGTVSRENLIWNVRLYGNEFRSLPESEAMQKQTTLIFGKNTITVQGLTGDFSYYNGVYQIETSAPDSWGVPITN